MPLPPRPAADGKPLLYVLNNNAEFLELIREVLADVNLRVVVEQLRPNPEVTLENFRSSQPDLILLDYVPFISDARYLLEALRASADLRKLPVLLASTSPQAATALADQFSGQIIDVLPKPFELEELYRLLRQFLSVATP
jgi:CheY-like chemotaxis protein